MPSLTPNIGLTWQWLFGIGSALFIACADREGGSAAAAITAVQADAAECLPSDAGAAAWSVLAGSVGARASSAAESVALRASPLPPLSASAELLELAVPSFGPPTIAVPIGAREPRPVVIALHAHAVRAADACSNWQRAANGWPFVLCPFGLPADAQAGQAVTLGGAEYTALEIAAGMRALQVTLKQWTLPAGVLTRVHNNHSSSMKPIKVCPGIATRYVSPLTEATAVISISLLKDHSICGYTGGLKNVTHGSIVNPHDHHRHQANPQIAELYAHPILSSRVRLHITDGFKLIYDQGPLDKNPARRILHGAVHAATDVVALDTIGAEIVDGERVAHGLPTLARAKRPPKYIESASALGLGVADRARIQLQEVKV